MAATVAEAWRVVTDRRALADVGVQTERILARVVELDQQCSRVWEICGEAVAPSVEESYRAARSALWGVWGDLHVVRSRIRHFGEYGGAW